MDRDRQMAGPCPKCVSGAVTCLHNHFETATRTIDSWEHRCGDCGYRVTQAFRTDDSDFDPTINPRVCPFCARLVANG
jgi:hypothetical protein